MHNKCRSKVVKNNNEVGTSIKMIQGHPKESGTEERR
jgi:hypothetical protein